MNLQEREREREEEQPNLIYKVSDHSEGPRYQSVLKLVRDKVRLFNVYKDVYRTYNTYVV